MAIGNASNNSVEENGKYCHQCRHKKVDVMAYCKKLKKDKRCTHSYCRPCLLNRYGENAEKVVKLEDWNCPKCRGICNCSDCMLKKGSRPIGRLTDAAKQSGFSTVHEVLSHHQCSGVMNSIHVAEIPNAALDSLYKKCLTASKRRHNQCAEVEEDNKEEGLHLNNKNRNTRKKGTKGVKRNPTAQSEVSVTSGSGNKPCSELCKPEKLTEAPEGYCQPQGSPLREVAGVKFLPEDIGSAFQFLDFCNSFAKVLDIKEGQPECILRDLVRGSIGCRGLSSPIAQFNIKLLCLIEDNITEENWVQTLGKHITKSQCLLDILPRDIFGKGLSGYDNLDQSEKLRILNFLFDEILGTVKLRNCIDKENTRFFDEMKEIKEKVLAVRKEEKLLRQQVRDGITRALGVTLSFTEHGHAISGRRIEADEKYVELLKSIENLPKKASSRAFSNGSRCREQQQQQDQGEEGEEEEEEQGSWSEDGREENLRFRAWEDLPPVLLKSDTERRQS